MAELPDFKKMNVHQRLNWVQQQVDYIQKEKPAGMRYSIVSHDAVTAKIRPWLVQAGVIYYPIVMEFEQQGNRTQMQGCVRYASIDNPAIDYIDVATAGYGIDEQDKGPGKAISYGVKYSILKVLGLESGDDPDDNQNAEFEDPKDENIQTINGFKTAIEDAKDEASLLEAFNSRKGELEKAGKVYPEKMAAARSAYAAKLHVFKKKDEAKTKA